MPLSTHGLRASERRSCLSPCSLSRIYFERTRRLDRPCLEVRNKHRRLPLLHRRCVRVEWWQAASHLHSGCVQPEEALPREDAGDRRRPAGRDASPADALRPLPTAESSSSSPTRPPACPRAPSSSRLSSGKSRPTPPCCDESFLQESPNSFLFARNGGPNSPPLHPLTREQEAHPTTTRGGSCETRGTHDTTQEIAVTVRAEMQADSTCVG